MENKSEEQFIIMLKYYKQDTDEKMTKLSEDFKTIFAVLSDQINKSNQINTMSSSSTQNDTLTPTDPTTMVLSNRRDPPLEGGQYTKIGGMWTLKHEIRSPKFYELLIKKELKGDTALDLKNLFNYIKMCLNAVTRLREDLLPDYQSVYL